MGRAGYFSERINFGGRFLIEIGGWENCQKMTLFTRQQLPKGM